MNLLKKNKRLYSKFLAVVNAVDGFKTEYKRFYLTKTAYELTGYGDRIKKLQSIADRKQCFIIGNGPSLRTEDLNKLTAHITFASNRIYEIYGDTTWRPVYYAATDDKYLKKSILDVMKCEAKKIFLPYNIEGVVIPQKSNIYRLYIDKTDRYPELPLFSENVSEQIYECYTVTYCLLQLAIYMGYKEIYLLGMDHSYSVERKADGTIVHNSVKNHFGDMAEITENQYLPSTDKSTNAFIAAKKYADMHGIKIYNATRGGKLEVFERVDFDEIVKEYIK